jgi:cytochrome c-type biogenesis protein CcmH
MIEWLGIAVLIVIATVLVVPPLLIRRREPASRAAHDLEVYKDQLREIEGDLASGLLSRDEAAAARTEIQRRILAAASRRAPQAAPAGRRSLPAAIALGVVVPLAALGLYAVLGAPGTPSLPVAERPAMDAMKGQDVAKLVDTLAQRMAADPDDVRGWLLLARSQRALGRFDQSAKSFRQAIEHGADDAETYAERGEVLIGADSGAVGTAAREAFAAALERDPANPRARYYIALGKAQNGDLEGALADWRALRDEAPAGVAWMNVLDQQIAAAESQLAGGAAQPAPPAAAPGPTQADVEAAAGMSGEEQATFIRSMVNRLAARLAKEPDDLDGWLRLARAYRVLGETGPLRDALQNVLRLAPNHPLALFQMGELEAAAGNTAEAERLWRRVADMLPQDSRARAEVESRIKALAPAE